MNECKMDNVIALDELHDILYYYLAIFYAVFEAKAAHSLGFV